MTPRSQGGCNCELQKKQMISSKTVVQYTRTESGRLTLKSVRLPEAGRDMLNGCDYDCLCVRVIWILQDCDGS